ncbi:MAG: c-type cytochrome [Betaproteobacteria bacterium]|nr:c-type cytochrome [Betaproteobacteria bacterium]
MNTTRGFTRHLTNLALATALAATGLPLAWAGNVSGPLAQAVAKGKDIFAHDTFGGRGMTCQACHTAGGTTEGTTPSGAKIPSLSNAAAIFPRYAHGQLVTLEDQVRRCVAGALGGKPPAYDSTQMRDLVAYMTSLSQGKPVDMGGKPR